MQINIYPSQHCFYVVCLRPHLALLRACAILRYLVLPSVLQGLCSACVPAPARLNHVFSSPIIIYWRNCSLPVVCSWLLIKKMNYIWVILFLVLRFCCFISSWVHLIYANTILYIYCPFEMFKIGKCYWVKPPALFFLKITLAIWSLLWFYIDVGFFFSCEKMPLELWSGLH